MSSASIRAMTSWLQAERHALQRLGQTHVVREPQPSHRHRARRLDALEGRGQRGGDLAVLDDHHLVGSAQLFVDGTAERPVDLTGVVAAIHRKQKGERNSHAGEVSSARDQPVNSPRPGGDAVAKARGGPPATAHCWSHPVHPPYPAPAPRRPSLRGVGIRDCTVICGIVTRDRPELLERAVSAVAAQSRRPDHLVLVDNGSDPRAEAVAAGSGIPFTYLPSATNLGGAGGRLRRAAGQGAGRRLDLAGRRRR